jgi:hypothetical protein
MNCVKQLEYGKRRKINERSKEIRKCVRAEICILFVHELGK